MPIKWSALQVSEAMDMVEGYVDQAAEPLEQAKIVTAEAMNIENIPQYLSERLMTLIANIDRINDIRHSIKVVRELLPGNAVEEELRRIKNGSQLCLVN